MGQPCLVTHLRSDLSRLPVISSRHSDLSALRVLPPHWRLPAWELLGNTQTCSIIALTMNYTYAKYRLLWSPSEETLLCDKTSPGEIYLSTYLHLLIPDRESRTEQSTNTNKVQRGEPLSLLGLLTGEWMRDYWLDRTDSKTAAALKATQDE